MENWIIWGTASPQSHLLIPSGPTGRTWSRFSFLRVPSDEVQEEGLFVMMAIFCNIISPQIRLAPILLVFWKALKLRFCHWAWRSRYESEAMQWMCWFLLCMCFLLGCGCCNFFIVLCLYPDLIMVNYANSWIWDRQLK